MTAQSHWRALGTALGLIVLAPALAACGQLRSHQGYIYDPLLAAAIQPGVDNRESVERTLGRPTFTGQFETGDWYYLSRDTRQLAFASPRATAQLLTRISFDDKGNVANVSRTGLETVVSIDPDNDKTPTLGSERSFFEDLFGNIGAVGAPGAGGGPNGSNTGGP